MCEIIYCYHLKYIHNSTYFLTDHLDIQITKLLVQEIQLKE